MAYNNILRTSVILILCTLVIAQTVFDFFQSVSTKSIISLILMLLVYRSAKKYYYGGKIVPFNKAILITGCGNGFGYHLAKRLDSKGFYVFASFRTLECAGAKELQQTCSSRLKVLHLDVTKDETISNAVTFVKEDLGSNDLWALVNNAGILNGFSFDFSTIQNFKDTFDVNALGPVKVTKAFLPLLKQSKGRIINISSHAGRIYFKAIFAYTLSKHAISAFTECLRLEMNPWGIRVISIEPEAFRTQMSSFEYLSRNFDNLLKEVDEEIICSYGVNNIMLVKKALYKYAANTSNNISIVLDDIESAIIERNPHHTYKPRRNLLYSVCCNILEYSPRGLYEMMYRLMDMYIGYPTINAM